MPPRLEAYNEQGEDDIAFDDRFREHLTQKLRQKVPREEVRGLETLKAPHAGLVCAFCFA